jgi:hypothetical protein
MDVLTEKRGYWKLKKEALRRTLKRPLLEEAMISSMRDYRIYIYTYIYVCIFLHQVPYSGVTLFMLNFMFEVM